MKAKRTSSWPQNKLAFEILRPNFQLFNTETALVSGSIWSLQQSSAMFCHAMIVWSDICWAAENIYS